MLYLLFVLTFLAGILFYGMSPRDDKLQMDMHQAEGMIISFVNQHQAAKDYLYTWLGAGPRGDAGSNIKGNGYLQADFEDMIWGKEVISGVNPVFLGGIRSDMCDGNTLDDDGRCFVSQTVCLNAAGNVVGCNNAAARYVMTYGGWGPGYTRPDWWPAKGQRMRKFESWRKAISKRTRDSVSCGFLFWNGSGNTPNNETEWCIDNGQTAYKRGSVCQNPVPSQLINAVRTAYGLGAGYAPLNDMLFCYSNFKQGLPGNYVSGASHFYDGLDNVGIGQNAIGNNVTWVNLVNTAQTIGSRNFPDDGAANPKPLGYCQADAAINTGIALGPNYTLTIILSCPERGFCDIFTARNGGTDTQIFQKTNGDEQFGASLGGGITADACNGASATKHGNGMGIISWTFVARTSGGTQSMTIYENATKGPFHGNLGASTSDQSLVIGGTGSPRIYGIRYYPNIALTQEQVAQNFKVDQKRFGFPDRNNGEQIGSPDIDGGIMYCKGARAADMKGGWSDDPNL